MSSTKLIENATLLDEIYERYGRHYVPLTEANLNRIVNGHNEKGYGVLSASRGNLSQEENNKRTKELKAKINDLGYSHVPVLGGYREEGQDKASLEKSLIVYPYNRKTKEYADINKFEDDLVDLGQGYQQDTVMIKRPTESPKYITCNDRTPDMEFGNGYVANDMGKEVFTALKKWSDSSLNRKNHKWNNGKPQRFTLESYEAYIDQQPMSVTCEVPPRYALNELFSVGFTGVVDEPLEENVVKHALFGDYKHKIKTFAIMTPENPMGKALSPEDNNKRVDDFLNHTRHANIQTIPINGMFDIGERNRFSKRNYGDNKYNRDNVRNEHSFILINCSLDEAKGLANKFGQKSFFFGKNYWGESVSNQNIIDDDEDIKSITDNDGVDEHTASTISYYDRPTLKSDFVLEETSRRIDDANAFDNFFSKYKDYKYSIYMKIFNENYDTIHTILDMESLNEALRKNRTAINSSLARRHAYDGAWLEVRK